MREEERAGSELVAAADDVPRMNLKKMSGESSSRHFNRVVPTPVGIFEELA